VRGAATEALPERYGPHLPVEFRILGPLEVVGEAGPVRLGGPKQRATLASLLLRANSVVSVDQLAEDLYAGAPPVTAVTQVQRQISELRKALGSASVIETRAPGYVIHVLPDQFDLDRFERWTEEASQALARGDADVAAELFRQALALWRGSPLADFAYEAFARTSIERLEEMRLAVVERLAETQLALGRHTELVGELEALVRDHPLRERLRGLLMLALYRSGRQAEALDLYRTTREALVETFGIEPTPALRELERAILTQDPLLDPERAAPARSGPAPEPERAVLVLPSRADRLDELVRIGELLAKHPAGELIIARLLGDEGELALAASALNALRASLDVAARTATFTTRESARDAVRLATAYDVELVLLDAPDGLDGDVLPGELVVILERSPADVAVLEGSVDIGGGKGVHVPFGGSEHDWAAVELGARLAVAAKIPLRLVGTTADPGRGQRDASRLLADASLAVQRVVGVETEPLLAEPTGDALVAAVEPATMVVVGISVRWRSDGIGAMRRSLVREARPPTVLVHRGPRPGGLAPRESLTNFTWSITG
jgi:DNA-binding SARP family transcriptional activator